MIKATDIFVAAKERADAYVNALKGLGEALYDSITGATTKTAWLGTPAEYENLIEVNALARRVAKLPPEDMLRAGYEVQVADEADFNELPLMDELKRLGVDGELVWAMTLARATGGAVIVPFIDDGTSGIGWREPLVPERIREVKELRVISRKHAQPIATGSPIYRITSPDKAVPAVEMHESRLIIFQGERVPDDRKAQNGGWCNSIFVALEEPLKRCGLSWQAIGNMVVDGSVGVLKVKGFHGMLAARNDDQIRTRFHLMAHGRSVARALAVDADSEDFQYIAREFGGIPDTLYALMSELSSLTGIPITRLFGRSAAGMNATGDGDERSYFDMVASDRMVSLVPNHEKIVRMVMHQKKPGLAEPKRWSLCYNPMRQMSDKEQAEIRKLNSEASAIDITNQVITPEEDSISRYGGKKYSSRIQIDTKLREPLAGNVDDTEGGGGEGERTGTGPGLSEDVQKTLPNGAQVAAAIDIVTKAAAKEIPRASAVQALVKFYGLTTEEAEALVADAGNGFEQPKKEPPPNGLPQRDRPPPDREEDVPG